MDKHTCRLEMKKRLASISESEFVTKSKNLSSNLYKYLQNFDLSSQTIGVFSPIEKEPHWFLELEEVAKYHFAQVSIEKDYGLSFYKMPLEKISGGLPLKLTDTESFKKVNPDILLIPGLGFSEGLDRLGRGKGYYDRYLADFSGTKIGICFEEQVIAKIETNKLDIKMNLIITDKKIYKERNIK